VQLTQPARRWNRYDVAPPFVELTVIGERPAVVTGRQLCCKRRVGATVLRCPYYDDCAENVARSGCAFCEGVVIGIVGDGTLVEV